MKILMNEEEFQGLLRDRERLDWLADKSQMVGNVELPRFAVEENLNSLRGAIDAAMGETLTAAQLRKRATEGKKI